MSGAEDDKEKISLANLLQEEDSVDMMSLLELTQAVKAYDPHADEDLLGRAYSFALKAHETQERASGDPYFTHPLEVAQILIKMHLDAATIVTALLHDTIEDTLATPEQIESLFGTEISFLVNGVTKLSQIAFQSDQVRQAENFRNFFLAMSSDIRVLLVKLADRLHNMRTLHFVPSAEKRVRISQETMEIYAPLAERIGLQALKDELEDLAFAQLHPEEYSSIVTRLKELREQEKPFLQPIIDEIEQKLREEGLDASVTGREKTPYSIWRKMQTKHVTFEQLADIMAFRIVVETIPQCYQALGIIHSVYSVLPGRFKDYISTPKANDYKSIHTSIIGPRKYRIEVQIRTKGMDKVCELGVAAHWQYKQGIKRDSTQYAWIQELLEILDKAEGPEEFLEHTKLEMFQDRVFCFTPKGDLITLPHGATAVDFAYAVHSNVGDHCAGVRINGRMLPLRTVLKNGDQVSILTSKNQHPSPTWEKFVVTGKARASIRRFIRQQMRQQFVALGKSVLQKEFQNQGLKLDEKQIGKHLAALKVGSVSDLYAILGEGLRHGNEVIRLLYPEHQMNDLTEKKGYLTPKQFLGSKQKTDIVGLIPGMDITFAGCCHPVPGDSIVAIITTGKGATIHTSNCRVLDTYMDAPERWIDVQWNDGAEETDRHAVRIFAIVVHHPGNISVVTAIITRQGAHIVDFHVRHRTPEFYELVIDISVKSLEHLKNIIASLRTSQSVVSVERG